MRTTSRRRTPPSERALALRCVPLIAATFFCLLLPQSGLGQTQHSPFPVDILAGPAPWPVMADHRIHLLYELHLTSFAPWPIELTEVDVLGDGRAEPLARYRAEELATMLVPAEHLLSSQNLATPAESARQIGAGHAALLFLDVVLAPGAAAPAELHHRFFFSFSGSKGTPIQKTLEGAAVSMVREPLPVLHPPLRGASWVAFNALSSENHRRAFNAVDGRMRIAERFAIDWMQLGPDKRLFRTDGKTNADFYGYGAEVLAVAEGRVVDLRDGLAERDGSSERSQRVVTLETIVGNYLTLDLGHGHFALYAHLQPGSLRVRLGDTVKAGQVLGRLGNSGNSDEPHLHFQLMDANSPLGAEGLPYVLEQFQQAGILPSPTDPLDQGQPWRPTSNLPPALRHNEFPLDNSVLNLP